MALIKCPGCSAEVSENSANCIKCGYPIKDIIKCPECGTYNAGKDGKPEACASCGCLLEKPAAPAAPARNVAAKPKGQIARAEPSFWKKYKVLIIVVAAVLAFLVVGGVLAKPKFEDASARAKAAEAPTIIRAFENAFLAALAEGMDPSRIGLGDLIFSPLEYSSYWRYDFVMPGGKVIATSKGNMARAGAGSVMTSTYNAAGDCFVHTAEPQLAKLIPQFMGGGCAQSSGNTGSGIVPSSSSQASSGAFSANATITKEEWAILMQDADFKAADQRLAEAYKKAAEAQWSDDLKQALLKEQRAWITKRERDAFAYANKGTPEYKRFFINEANKRTAELREYAW